MSEVDDMNRLRVQAERELHEVRDERDQFKRDYENACSTIELIHFSATGRRGEAPKRGVVEDVADMKAKCDALDKAAEMLWAVLANVSGGDWTKQTQEWQDAAAKWRDNYFATIRTPGAEVIVTQ